MRQVFSLLLIVSALTGCGGYITSWGDSFEGAGDYGHVSPGATAVAEKYTKGSGGELVVGDYVSISLKSGYITQFPESSLKRGLNWVARSPVRGEVAILVDVTNNGLSGRETMKSGRVVFYSDDVYEGQMLNISFIPVYGPVKYEGQPLGLSVRVLELDNADNAQIKGVLDAIASVGAASTTAGSPLLTNSMKDIGDALVKSNADDTFGAFDAMFLGAGKDFGSTAPELKIGDYVLIRKEDRMEGIDWKYYCYNEARGMLQMRGELNRSSCNTVNRQPDFSYIVFSVSRNVGVHDMTPELKVNELLEELKATPSASQMRKVANNAVRDVIRSATMSRVRDSLDILSREKTTAVSRQLNAQVVANALQCSSLSRLSYDDLKSEFEDVKGLCGDYFIDGSLSLSDYEYVANRLVVIKNCLVPAEIKTALFYENLNAAELEAKRSALVTKLSACGA